MFDEYKKQVADHLDQLKADHKIAVGALDKLIAVVEVGDERMKETVGVAAHKIKDALANIHDRIRHMRGGDPEAEHAE